MPESPINTNIAIAAAGLNMDSSLSRLQQGQLTFAMNAMLSSVSGDMVTYSNESGNTFQTTFPEGFTVIGKFSIHERDLDIFFLTSPGEDQIGYLEGGQYTPKIKSACLHFSTFYPIHKVVYKTSTCGTEIYWTDAYNQRRWLNWDNPPYLSPGALAVDCNKLSVQPDFSIPEIKPVSIENGGTTLAGTYQFAIQYSNGRSEGYTSYYSVTNPVPLYNEHYTGPDFNYPVNKSIQVAIANLDPFFSYFNLAVIRTVNAIPTFELVGTYDITSSGRTILYTGQNIHPLSEEEVFLKYPIFTTAQDVTSTQDIIIWTGLTEPSRISYQEIWNKTHLQWVGYKAPKELYKDGVKAAQYRHYTGDEVYSFEGVFLLKNGKQTDRFHIPGRPAIDHDLELISGEDVPNLAHKCDTPTLSQPRWKVYNTASITGKQEGTSIDCYEGAYHWGEFSYWESEELYPNNPEIWGELANTPVRHHKFPDSTVHQIQEGDSVFPLGVRIDIHALLDSIQHSDLSQEDKDNIQGFKIVRANRAGQESIVAKGIINNVLKYTTDGKIVSGNNDASGGNSLLDSAINTLNQAILSVQTGGLGTNNDLENKSRGHYLLAKAALNKAKPLTPGSPEYKAAIQTAITETKTGAVKAIVGDMSYQYAQSAISIMESLLSLEVPQELPGIIPIENSNTFLFPNYLYNDVTGTDPFLDYVTVDEDSKSRFTFHSPDTHFTQPSLGDILKLETIEEGISYSKLTQVKNHSRYQFVNDTAYITALIAGSVVGFASGTYGLANNVFNGTAAFTAYQAMVDIIFKVTPHKNFCYQVNSIGNYSHHKPVPNSGNKQRSLNLSSYLTPGMHSVGDTYQINNWQRESSVYLNTTTSLPYPHQQGGQEDKSKILYPTLGITPSPISTYYASLKRTLPSQYGQVYSYESVDTGFQYFFKDKVTDTVNDTVKDFFGGDSYITPFSLKIKLPFFIDNRVGQNGQQFIDDSDIAYNELSNVGKVKYWFSTDASSAHGFMSAVFGVKDHHFYWERDTTFSDNGMIFLFAMAIPTFWVESTVNTYLRQATNTKEGDFYPHVGTGIPDEWLQPTNVDIAWDNQYTYNSSFSKQNKESYFSFLPTDWKPCQALHPFKGIYSEAQQNDTSFNHWLIYKPDNAFTLPNTYGKLVSMEGIDNRQVLARFENSTLLYNYLQTIPTSSGQAYLGSPLFSKEQPPYNYSTTDLGYVGTQNHIFLKTPYGNVAVDAKRKQIFLFQGQQVKPISGSISSFLNQHLPFHITKQFPKVATDNHFIGIGLHGAYDSEAKRVLITKLDYEPLSKDIVLLEDSKFMKGTVEVSLQDTNYFANHSWTLSFTFEVGDTPVMNWTSFHSYTPKFYLHKNEYFYTSPGDSLWLHNNNVLSYNNYYGEINPFTIEYPFSYKQRDEILQSVKTNIRALKYENETEYIQTDDVFYDQCILYSNQQCSGILQLAKKPKNAIAAVGKYPIYNEDSKVVVYSKSDDYYNVNTFWDLVKDKKKSIWVQSIYSPHKELNQSNMSYSKRSYSKSPLRTMDLKCRFTLNSTSDFKFISQIVITESVTSYK